MTTCGMFTNNFEWKRCRCRFGSILKRSLASNLWIPFKRQGSTPQSLCKSRIPTTPLYHRGSGVIRLDTNRSPRTYVLCTLERMRGNQAPKDRDSHPHENMNRQRTRSSARLSLHTPYKHQFVSCFPVSPNTGDYKFISIHHVCNLVYSGSSEAQSGASLQ